LKIKIISLLIILSGLSVSLSAELTQEQVIIEKKAYIKKLCTKLFGEVSDDKIGVYLLNITASFDANKRVSTDDLKKDEKFFAIRGFIYFDSKQYDNALLDLSECIKLKKDFSEGYFYRAKSYYYQGKLENALNDFNKFISLDSTDSSAFYYRGIIYMRTNKYLEAIKDFNEVLKKEPKYAKIYRLKGEIFLALDKNKEAVSSLKKAIGFGDIEAVNILAYFYAENEIYLKDAEYLIKQILIENSNNYIYRDTLGLVLYKQSKYKEAEKELLVANKISGEDFFVKKHLAECYLKLNNNDKAKKFFQEALAFARTAEEKEFIKSELKNLD